jgi:hypothetical protein
MATNGDVGDGFPARIHAVIGAIHPHNTRTRPVFIDPDFLETLQCEHRFDSYMKDSQSLQAETGVVFDVPFISSPPSGAYNVVALQIRGTPLLRRCVLKRLLLFSRLCTRYELRRS